MGIEYSRKRSPEHIKPDQPRGAGTAQAEFVFLAVGNCPEFCLVAFLHLSAPRAAPDRAGKNLQDPWEQAGAKPPELEQRLPQLFLLGVGNLWDGGSGRVGQPQDITPKEKKMNRENSSPSSQCHTNPLEIALSTGL